MAARLITRLIRKRHVCKPNRWIQAVALCVNSIVWKSQTLQKLQNCPNSRYACQVVCPCLSLGNLHVHHHVGNSSATMSAPHRPPCQPLCPPSPSLCITNCQSHISKIFIRNLHHHVGHLVNIYVHHPHIL